LSNETLFITNSAPITVANEVTTWSKVILLEVKRIKFHVDKWVFSQNWYRRIMTAVWKPRHSSF